MIVGDSYEVPDMPGLDVDIDEMVLTELAITTSAVRA